MLDNENICVIIATHNNVSTVERAINSVTTGLRPANNIVVADNDSTDGTYNKLCDLLGADNITIDGKTGLPPQFEGELNNVPIKIFRKKLTTTGHTINAAIQMHWRGVSIFGFLDPTSWYAPDKISQAIVAFNMNNAIACIVSDCDNHYKDGRVERVFRSSFDLQKLLYKSEYDRNFLIRMQVFQKLQAGFNENLKNRDDYDLLLRISEIGLIYHIAAPLHNNIITEPSEEQVQSSQQNENIIRQFAIQRRNQNE